MTRYKTDPNKKIYSSTRDIKNQLRDILNASTVSSFNKACEVKVVVTRRAIGKTTALVQFVAERIMTTEKIIAVGCFNQNSEEEFRRCYCASFPTLPEPIIFSASSTHILLQGKKVDEVYIEEIFLLQKQDLRDLVACAPILIGVGSIEQPTTITITI